MRDIYLLTGALLLIVACSKGGDANKDLDRTTTPPASTELAKPEGQDVGAAADRPVTTAPGDGGGPGLDAGPGKPRPLPGDDDDDDFGDDDDDDVGGGESCVSVSCLNGSCTCGSGPRRGQRCTGETSSGANACSVVCRHSCD